MNIAPVDTGLKPNFCSSIGCSVAKYLKEKSKCRFWNKISEPTGGSPYRQLYRFCLCSPKDVKLLFSEYYLFFYKLYMYIIETRIYLLRQNFLSFCLHGKFDEETNISYNVLLTNGLFHNSCEF